MDAITSPQLARAAPAQQLHAFGDIGDKIGEHNQYRVIRTDASSDGTVIVQLQWQHTVGVAAGSSGASATGDQQENCKPDDNINQGVRLRLLNADKEPYYTKSMTFADLQILQTSDMQQEYAFVKGPGVVRFKQSWQHADCRVLVGDDSVSVIYTHGDVRCGARTAFFLPVPARKEAVPVKILNNPLHVAPPVPTARA
jgi:hypothetical protein